MVKEVTRCRYMSYSFRLASRVLLYVPSHRQDSTAFVTPVMENWLEREIAQWVHSMKDRSDDPSHHERTLLPRSYISLYRCVIKLYIYHIQLKNTNSNKYIFLIISLLLMMCGSFADIFYIQETKTNKNTLKSYRTEELKNNSTKTTARGNIYMFIHSVVWM